MDVAVLGEIRDGREVVRFVAGDGSFDLVPGASMPIEDTYCHRLLPGRLSNVVPDAHADDQLRTFRSRVLLGSVPTSAFRSRRSTRVSTCSVVWHMSSGHTWASAMCSSYAASERRSSPSSRSAERNTPTAPT